MASSVLAFGLFPGLQRPAIGGAFIKLAPKITIMDLGAQIDSRPTQLLSTAALGCTFSRLFMEIPNPRVGILSVGAEEGKGNAQVRATYPLLQASGLNFVGNVEAHEIFQDRTDVLICDGFVGNILLKFTEGLADAVTKHLRSAPALDASLIRNFPGLADNTENSSGPLFGVNGVMIIGHGRTEAAGVARAIVRANEALNLDLVEIMRNELESIMKTTNSDINSRLKDGG
jgi:glycerol-3-phosphate acyltransferase PlsX